ncbi:MAG: hypothetical protein K940chlam6_00420 [Chlamydiae bacterium]|nr:hypothetical protein [Chlamydiota bacterium]
MRLSHCLLCIVLFFSFGWAQDPEILYLTWKGDPATTMTVMWHTTDGNGPTVVYYTQVNSKIGFSLPLHPHLSSPLHRPYSLNRPCFEDRKSGAQALVKLPIFESTYVYQPPEEAQWQKQEGTSHRLQNSSVTVHQVELSNLVPDTDYSFRLEDGDIHRLRTMPDGLTRPIRAVVGGDAYFSEELYRKMNREVASRDPDFVILAGDIAYTEGLSCALRTRYWKINRWEEFFTYWSKDMVTKEGRLIPIVPVLGNHDVKEGFDDPYKKEVLFYQFFVFPKPEIPYRVFQIGSDLCFFLLDSCHTYPIGGLQTEWLKKALNKHQNALYRIPVYHIAAYPSENSYTHRGSKDIRKFWVPLFEKYGVKISMEHDNHDFKRTYPIWQGRVDPKGILYLGDGAWGVFPEKPRRHWYLAKALRTNCYWLLTINQSKLLAEAFDNEGELIDQVEISPGK